MKKSVSFFFLRVVALSGFTDYWPPPTLPLRLRSLIFLRKTRQDKTSILLIKATHNLRIASAFIFVGDMAHATPPCGPSYSSELQQMLRWGLRDSLRQLERSVLSHRQLRLVCRELRAEADTLTEALCIPLDDAACSDTALSQRMAAFHRRCTAAHILIVHVDGNSEAVSHFIDSYAAAIGQAGLPKISACTVIVAGDCWLYPCVLRSLLSVLPALSEAVITAGSDAPEVFESQEDAVQALAELAGCPHLEELALDHDFPEPHAGAPAALAACEALAQLTQLTQLRALSLNCELNDLQLPFLARLTRLERRIRYTLI